MGVEADQEHGVEPIIGTEDCAPRSGVCARDQADLRDVHATLMLKTRVGSDAASHTSSTAATAGRRGGPMRRSGFPIMWIVS